VNEVVFVDQSADRQDRALESRRATSARSTRSASCSPRPLAQQRNYGPGMFSFNAGDGRCPTCGGSGFEHVEMQFLSDVYLRCPDCDGRRYRAEMLDVKIECGATAAVDRRRAGADRQRSGAVFAEDAEVMRVLQPIVDVGLEYVKLGQPVPTLSGGEAQRLKLAGFLAEAAQAAARSAKQAKKGTLFMFDEPTTGLHFDDIAKLMQALGACWRPAIR
jgi:excinuclease ABC subunit A